MQDILPELPKKLTPSLKKIITKDWHKYLPGLTFRKSMSLDRRVGPLIIGIGFQSSIEYYAPGFSVHNLSRILDFLSATLDEPLRTIRTNAPNSLKVRWHNRNYQEAAERMKNQALLPLEGPISLDDVISAYKKYVSKHRYPELISQLEDPALIAAWAGEEKRAQEALDWGYEVLKTWSEGVQNAQGGANAWRIKMEGLIANPEALRRTAREEAIKHKLTKIPCEDFIDTVYKENS